MGGDLGSRLRARICPALLALVACSPGPGQSSDAGRRAKATLDEPAAAARQGWRVTETSFGAIRIGMTVAEARSALGAELPDPQDSECDYVAPRNWHSGVDFMVVGGLLVRIDVQDTSIATAAGARIGDSEARVKQLYLGRISVEPHKYIDGHYLVVRPATRGSPGADSSARIVFETDGNEVIEYRAGRLPQVSWVEGCS